MPIRNGVIKPLDRSGAVDRTHMAYWFQRRCDANNLTTVAVPIIGRMYVHKRVAEAFVLVMESIERAGLGHLIDLADYRASGGTYNCRKTRGSSVWSPHAWGTAVDINVKHKARRDGTEYVSSGINFKCAAWEVAPSLKALAPHFNNWGFAWGGHFNCYLDPMHFEATELTVAKLEQGDTSGGPGPARLVVMLPGSEQTAVPIFRDGQHYITVRDAARLMGRELVDHRTDQGKIYLAEPED